MNPRILILSASVGTGHLRAAEAVEEAIHRLNPTAQVTNVDVLDFTNPAFRRFYGKSYFNLVARAPHLVGYLYDRLDRPSGFGMDGMRLAMERLNLSRFTDLLTEQPWDVAINTHFLPAEIIASLHRRGRVDFPQITVTTDFDTHRLWMNPPTAHYFTASEEGRTNLAAWGVALEDITASGIPIHPQFGVARDGQACRRRHGLAEDRPVVLQMAGGAGIGPIERICRSILGVDVPLQLVVLAGRNSAARARLDSIECPSRHRLKVLGFTTEMHELMAAADLVVTKPGALTTSEALASGTAMMIVDPIPGQETRNSDFVLENGAGIKVNNLASLGQKLGVLLNDRPRLCRMRDNAVRVAAPRAAFDVAAYVLRIAEHKQIESGELGLRGNCVGV